MAEFTNGAFPWQDFSEWLREGVVAARILNNFMLASSSEDTRPIKELPIVRQEELSLLQVIRDYAIDAGDNSKDAWVETISALAVDKPYPSISERNLRMLGKALMEYGPHSRRYGPMINQLARFARPYTANPDALVSTLMNNTWRGLGPAVAPDPNMLEGTRS
jgi:hypothetical protein